MKLWVDADACPRDVRDLLFRASERLSITTVLVANAPLAIPRLAHVTTVQVKAGLNVADAYIAREAQAGDVAVTADIPLAAELVRKGVVVVDSRGELLTPDNVEERLAMRNLMQELRESGIHSKGPRAFDARARQQFANTLDRVLTAAARRRTP